MSKLDEENIFVPLDSTESRSFNGLKADNELFDDESYQVQKLINVKRIDLPKGAEEWEILEDNEIVLSMKGTRFTNPEKKFLRTVEGMKFLIKEFKSGSRSVVKIKSSLKDLV